MSKAWSKGLEFVKRRNCVSCKKLFYAPPVLVRRGGGKFCSKRCRGAEISRLYRLRMIPNAICSVCTTSFYIQPSRKIRNKSRICSVRCRELWSAKTPRAVSGYKPKQLVMKFGQKHIPVYRSAQCLGCGRVFEIKKGCRGKLCSKFCWGKAIVKVIKGYSHPRGKGGKREDLGDHYFRSRWEANYARYLNWLVSLKEIQKWEYEPDTFEFIGIKRGTRFYTPDFKVWCKNGLVEYHEVKGWMSPISNTKLKRMARYHPKIKVVVIDGKSYGSIARQVRNLIPGWETHPKHL